MHGALFGAHADDWPSRLQISSAPQGSEHARIRRCPVSKQKATMRVSRYENETVQFKDSWREDVQRPTRD